MKSKLSWPLSVVLLTAATALAGTGQSVGANDTPPPSANDLYATFRNPPAAARPRVFWWWPSGCVTDEEIQRQLDILHRNGIGGVRITRPYSSSPVKDPPNPKFKYSFTNDEWRRLMGVLLQAGVARDMAVDLEMHLSAPKSKDATMTILRSCKVLGPQQLRLSPPELYTRLSGPYSKVPADAVIQSLRLLPARISDLKQVRDVTTAVKPGADIELTIPDGEHRLWAALRVPGDFYLNPRALAESAAKLTDELWPLFAGTHRLRQVFRDSMEIGGGALWTADLTAEFQKRRGYDLDPYLPFVQEQDNPDEQGPLVETVRRARYDYSRTVSELLHERYDAALNNWARTNGLQLHRQAHGVSFWDPFPGYMNADIPESEQWLDYDFGRQQFILNSNDGNDGVPNRMASSAAHLTGKRLVSLESMTSQNSFQHTLDAIKRASDFNIITGINQVFLHTFVFNPPGTPFPGDATWGTFFSEQNTWWRFFPKWTAYHARLCAVAQEARMESDIAVYHPLADVWSIYGPAAYHGSYCHVPSCFPWLLKAVSSCGFTPDYVNDDILQKSQFKDGRLCYGPMAYRAVLVAEAHRMEPQTAAALARYAAAGGRIVFLGGTPDQSPSLFHAEENDAAVRATIEESLAAGPDHVRVVPDIKDPLPVVAEALRCLQVVPMVRLSKQDAVLLQARWTCQGRDIFFFANLDQEREVRVQATFQTGVKTPWRWDPETGARTVFPHGANPNELALRFARGESLLLVFEPAMPGESAPAHLPADKELLSITGPWTVDFWNSITGQSETNQLPALFDLGKSPDPALNTFSGTATYRATFQLAAAPKAARLDLGAVYDISELTINNQSLGVRWYGRHDYDVSSALRAGENALEIQVTTTVYNYARTLDRPPTRWLPDKKRTVPAGLVGPVRLLTEQQGSDNR
jgi:hypothetical protein